MDPKTLHGRLSEAAKRFHSEAIDERGGRDPVAALYAERRREHSLFSNLLSDQDLEALRPYLFCHGGNFPQRAGEKPVRVTNLVAGQWSLPLKGEMAVLVTVIRPLFTFPSSHYSQFRKTYGAQ